MLCGPTRWEPLSQTLSEACGYSMCVNFTADYQRKASFSGSTKVNVVFKVYVVLRSLWFMLVTPRLRMLPYTGSQR